MSAASATAGTAAASAAPLPVTPNGGRPDTAAPRFAIAVLPDTQYLFDTDSSDPEPLRATFRHLVREQAQTTSSS